MLDYCCAEKNPSNAADLDLCTAIGQDARALRGNLVRLERTTPDRASCSDSHPESARSGVGRSLGCGCAVPSSSRLCVELPARMLLAGLITTHAPHIGNRRGI